MKSIVTGLLAGALLLHTPSSQAQDNSIDTLLRDYTQQGAGPFTAARGKALWQRQFTESSDKQPRSCASCHTKDLRSTGKHVRTGKAIAPIAPSLNVKRLSDKRKIEKWFRRNCKWTLGRTCTAQEKGDFLSYLKQQ